MIHQNALDQATNVFITLDPLSIAISETKRNNLFMWKLKKKEKYTRTSINIQKIAELPIVPFYH